MKMWAEVSFVLLQCTRFTDRQTGRTDGHTPTHILLIVILRLHSCSAV